MGSIFLKALNGSLVGERGCLEWPAFACRRRPSEPVNPTLDALHERSTAVLKSVKGFVGCVLMHSIGLVPR